MEKGLGSIPDVGIYMFRISAFHSEQLASLVRTKRSFNLIYVYERGTAHQNINKVLDRATARYVAICDDDVIFLDDGWLDILIDELQRVKDAGLITPVETKDWEVAQQYMNGNKLVGVATHSTSWNPGYVMLLDRERVPQIRADEAIPGKWGMSDLDISLQVRQSHKVLYTKKVMVYHAAKPDEREWRNKFKVPMNDELILQYRGQVEYMVKKWGEVFASTIGNRIMEEV